MNLKKNIFILFIIVLVTSCNDSYIPKPREYFRISFPERGYQLYDTTCPYQFKYPKYAVIKPDKSYKSEPCWINIIFPEFKASLHLSYKDVTKNELNNLLEDSRTLAYKHTIKADAIGEQLYINDSLNVYGLLYQIKGNAASSIQFYVTDSVRNFLRGSLYFNTHPNKDSLAPVIEFLNTDIQMLIESLEWKNIKTQ